MESLTILYLDKLLTEQLTYLSPDLSWMLLHTFVDSHLFVTIVCFVLLNDSSLSVAVLLFEYMLSEWYKEVLRSKLFWFCNVILMLTWWRCFHLKLGRKTWKQWFNTMGQTVQPPSLNLDQGLSKCFMCITDIHLNVI